MIMNQQTLILIVIAAALIGWLIATTKKESLIPPWDLEKCRERCFKRGEQIPWFGGPEGPWDDPANFPSSNYDVAGCMANCDLHTWSESQY